MKDSKKYRINGFDQIKSFYSMVFNNEYRFTPHHISLYVFLINQNNRNNWVEWFKCPFDLGMAGSCIGSKTTYYKCLDDLKEWHIIDYQKGVNEWKAPLIKLEVLKCTDTDTDTDTATVPVSEPLPIPIPIPQEGIDINNKQLTYKPITENNAYVYKIQNFEQDFLNEYTRTELACKQLNIPINSIQALKTKFINEQIISGESYTEFDKVMKHFYHWLVKNNLSNKQSEPGFNPKYEYILENDLQFLKPEDSRLFVNSEVVNGKRYYRRTKLNDKGT